MGAAAWPRSSAARRHLRIPLFDQRTRNGNAWRQQHATVLNLLKDKQVTEDDVTRSEADIQKMTDKAIKDVDDVVKAKEQELMAV